MNSIRAIAEVTGAGRQQTFQAQNTGMSRPEMMEKVPQPQDGDAFLDGKGLRAKLPVSSKTLYNWRELEIIPYIKFPGTKRILYHWPSVAAALKRAQKGLEVA